MKETDPCSYSLDQGSLIRIPSRGSQFGRKERINLRGWRPNLERYGMIDTNSKAYPFENNNRKGAQQIPDPLLMRLRKRASLSPQLGTRGYLVWVPQNTSHL